MKPQCGFTLVELVVVIVMLGVLAATALPKFIDVSTDARIAAVNGLAGNLRSALHLVQTQFMVKGSSGPTLNMADGTVVIIDSESGFPIGSIAGIGRIVSSTQGFVVNYTGLDATFVPDSISGDGATCNVKYDATTGTAAADTSGC